MENKIISPCISICKTDPVTGYCYGCARTNEEKKQWKDENSTNEWKEENTKLLLDDPTPKEGYKMIWCANDPKGVAGAGDFKAYLAAIEAAGFTKKPMSKKKPGANTGGRRRTRRRTFRRITCNHG